MTIQGLPSAVAQDLQRRSHHVFGDVSCRPRGCAERPQAINPGAVAAQLDRARSAGPHRLPASQAILAWRVVILTTGVAWRRNAGALARILARHRPVVTSRADQRLRFNEPAEVSGD